jgi:parallel beta-helix repeat protein
MKTDNSRGIHTFGIWFGLIASALLLASGVSAATTYSITGHITNADNIGISGITVCTYSSNVCQKVSAPTDDSGKYTITGLKNNLYYVKVNVDDRNKSYFYLPIINPLTNIAPNFVSAVTVKSEDVLNIDFKKIEIPEAVSGFQWPMDYNKNNYGSTFGQYNFWLKKYGEGFHNGQDYNSYSNNGTCRNGIKGTPNYAVADGTIVDVRSKVDSCKDNDWGAVTIKHWYKGKAYYSNYLHISLDTANPVKIGQKVTKGMTVGYEDNIMPPLIGKNSKGEEIEIRNVHLHFEVKNDQAPTPYNKQSSTFIKNNVYKWYEHPDAFIESSGAYTNNQVIVVDDRELLYAGESPLPSRWFSVSDETKFTTVPGDSKIPGFGFGGNMQYAITTADSTPTAWGNWSFDISKEGNYEISTYIPSPNGESQKAVYKIDGKVISPPVDQSIVENDWVKLGDLHYLTIGSHLINLDNNDGEVGKKLAYDAMKVVYKDAPDASITVTSPNGGEVWPAGSTQTIKWLNSTKVGNSLSIDILKNGNVINGFCPAQNTGSASWTIPEDQIPGNDYRIRITDTANANYNDTSDSNFTISAPVSTPTPTPTPVGGPVHNVNKNIDYATIQKAIDDSTIGDEIDVYSGTYPESLNIAMEQIHIKGIDTGAGKPIIDNGVIGDTVTLAADKITFDGFEIRRPIHAPYKGIYVLSSYNIIADNNISMNDNGGIYLSSSSSKENLLFGNNVTNNSCGICLEFSNNNTIRDNNMSNNYNGISVAWSSNNNTVNNNNVSGSSNYGISVYICGGNKIYHNNFADNAIQAYFEYDQGNFWDSGYPDGGNYWKGYVVADLMKGISQDLPGSDGIGDVPYSIKGHIGGGTMGYVQDKYPLMSSI